MHFCKRVAGTSVITFVTTAIFAASPVFAAADPYTKMAKDFVAHIRAREKAPAAAMIDNDALIKRIEAGVPTTKEVADGFKDGVGELGVAQVSSIALAVSRGGHYTFIRIRQKGAKWNALFRLDLPDGSVDYHDWEIATNASGQLHYVDMYDLVKGEMVSQILRRLYLAAVVNADKNAGAQLAAREKEMVDNVDKIGEMSKAQQAQDFQKVLDIYKTLPRSVQQNKTVLFLRIGAAQQMPDPQFTEYDNAVADFEKAYPKDPALDLLELDHLVRNQQFAKAHQSLDRLTAFTGGDAHLDCAQGQVYLGAGTPTDLTMAAAEYKKAILAEPDNAEGYWGLTTVYLTQKDNASTATELTEIQNKLHLKMGDLTKVPVYADFVKSPEYKKWLASQPKAPPRGVKTQ